MAKSHVFCIFLAKNGVFNTNRTPRAADGNAALRAMHSIHKCVAKDAPHLFRVLHDIFILHKVIDQRYHGEDQCDPHNDIGKDLQLREVGDHQADHDHLEGGLELAPVTCGNDYAIVGSDQTEAADDKLSGDDDDDHPGRDTVHLDQCDHGGTY